MFWRRLDLPGAELARLERWDAGWRLAGTVLLVSDGQPCHLEYEVLCDEAWLTRRAAVEGTIGRAPVQVDIVADRRGQWRLNGADCPAVAGCLDVDLAFTPATNLLPLRRLPLAVGDAAPVRAAWLRFPELRLEPLEQLYRREAEARYRYESSGGNFVASLEVDDFGLVTRYGEYWVADTTAP